MRIGIDVGGTNTDAVLMDGVSVLAATKRPTTEDVLSGVVAAVRAILDESGVSPAQVESVMIGTTHFTNAVIERRKLASTAILRLGLPAAQSVLPFEDWPEDLRQALGGRSAVVHGGNEFDGRELSALDADEILPILREWVSEGVQAVAVCAVFSPISHECEERAAQIIADAFPVLDVVRSFEIGGLGLLERENASAINAALVPLARAVVGSFRESIAGLSIDAPLYITQNDGTLITAEVAERFPVLTFASGPTNSMRGAALLSGLQNALVLDVGGTTSDIGAIVDGFPRASAVAATFADVHTNFRMPDLVSFGLGGGTRVRPESDSIGPDSVGYRITEEALVFGGSTLTATDIAVAAGNAEIGDTARISELDPKTVLWAQQRMASMIEDALDRIRLSRDEQPVIVVGGGSILVPDALAGTERVVRPPHFSVANAVGAAIAQVSGSVDSIVALDEPREVLIERARLSAAERAVEAGADPATVRTVEMEDVALPYVDGAMTRIKVKVVGELLSSQPAPVE